MRYIVTFTLFAVVLHVATVAAALLIGGDSWPTILLSLLVGAIAGAAVVVFGLKGKLQR